MATPLLQLLLLNAVVYKIDPRAYVTAYKGNTFLLSFLWWNMHCNCCLWHAAYTWQDSTLVSTARIEMLSVFIAKIILELRIKFLIKTIKILFLILFFNIWKKRAAVMIKLQGRVMTSLSLMLIKNIISALLLLYLIFVLIECLHIRNWIAISSFHWGWVLFRKIYFIFQRCLHPHVISMLVIPHDIVHMMIYLILPVFLLILELELIPTTFLVWLRRVIGLIMIFFVQSDISYVPHKFLLL